MRGLVVLLLCAAALVNTAAGEYRRRERSRNYARRFRGRDTYDGGYYERDSGYRRLPPGTPYGYEPDTKKPLDQYDILQERVHALLDKIKFLSENVDALSATLSGQERRLNHLLNIVFPSLKQSILTLNDTFTTTEGNLEDLSSEVINVTSDLDTLKALNEENSVDGELFAVLLANQVRIDVQHDRDIQFLLTLAKALKHKLIQLLDNGLVLLNIWIKRDETRLNSVTERERHRKCETGHVNLKADDRRAEYLFQTEFSGKPQFDYGLKGFQFELGTIKDSKGSRYDTKNNKNTETMGVVAWAYPSPTGVTIQAFDESLGETNLKSVDVAYLACSIGPGTVFHNYYYYG